MFALLLLGRRVLFDLSVEGHLDDPDCDLQVAVVALGFVRAGSLSWQLD